MKKYDPLYTYLTKQTSETIRLTFDDIASIIADSLPESAYIHRAWWSNGHHAHDRAWLDASFKVDEVNFLQKYVIFTKHN